MDERAAGGTPIGASSVGRALELAIGAGMAAWWALLVWERLDPEGPREAYTAARERVAEWVSWRRALQRTLDEIDDLPETPNAGERE